jgi:hypothetical protein
MHFFFSRHCRFRVSGFFRKLMLGCEYRFVLEMTDLCPY